MLGVDRGMSDKDTQSTWQINWIRVAIPDKDAIYHDSRPFSPFHDEVILPTHAHSLICFISFFFLYSF